MNIKSLESNIGFVSIIIALSPFIESFKNTNLLTLSSYELTVYDLYFTFSCLLVSFIFFQLYYDIFFSKNPNSIKRLKYLKRLNFIYYITLTAIPILTLNILFFRFFINKTIPFVVFLSSVVIYCYQIFQTYYYRNFQNFEKNETLKTELLNNLNLSSFLLQEGDYELTIKLHYNISKKHLLFLSTTEYEDPSTFSFTDCLVKAYKKHKISNEQETEYKKIVEQWDHVNLEDKGKIKKEQVFLNQIFLESELKKT